MCPSLARGLHIGSPQQCELLPSQQTCSVLHVRLHFPHLNNVTHKTVEWDIFRVERFCGKLGLRIHSEENIQVNCLWEDTLVQIPWTCWDSLVTMAGRTSLYAWSEEVEGQEGMEASLRKTGRPERPAHTCEMSSGLAFLEPEVYNGSKRAKSLLWARPPVKPWDVDVSEMESRSLKA